MKDFSTISMDPGLYSMMEKPTCSKFQFFQGPISKYICNRDQKEEVVMDMGCGPGNFSTRLILSLMPNLKRIYAVDLLQNMIDHAKEHCPQPKVEYCLGDISNWSSVEKWEGQISSFFSINVIHWIKDQKQSFQNIYKLLKPGGQAAFCFFLQSSFFDTCLELKNDVHWSKYLKDVDLGVPQAHIEKYEPEYYTNLMTDLGFRIEYCKAEVKTDPFPSDAVCRDFFSSICTGMQHIPTEMKDQFKDAIFDSLLRSNGRVEGLPVQRGRMMELIIRKPEE